MLVCVSVVSAHIEETHKRWKLEAFLKAGQTDLAVQDERFPVSATTPKQPPSEWRKEGFRILPYDPTELGPAFGDVSRFSGLMYVLDLENDRRLWQHEWGPFLATPSGFCFADDRMYCADLEGSNIFEVDMYDEPGRLVRRFSHPWLNDVHGITQTRRGFLVASTGTDMVIELDRDGRCLYEWWAGDHGFTTTEDGSQRLPDRAKDHRDRYYHTRTHTTHLNAAHYRDRDETRLLVLLRRQGMLVEIDTTQPAGCQHPRTVLDGLCHPHTIRPLPDGGWMIANSQDAEIVVLDADLRVRQRVPSVEGWLQDALPLGDGRWLVADVNRFRLLLQDDAGRELRDYPFHRSWRAFALQMVPREMEAVFLNR